MLYISVCCKTIKKEIKLKFFALIFTIFKILTKFYLNKKFRNKNFETVHWFRSSNCMPCVIIVCLTVWHAKNLCQIFCFVCLTSSLKFYTVKPPFSHGGVILNGFRISKMSNNFLKMNFCIFSFSKWGTMMYKMLNVV